MAAIAGRVDERFRHEGRTQPVLFRVQRTMYLKKAWRSAVFKAASKPQFHLELSVRVLMIVLIGLPAERQHGIADLGNDIVSSYHRLLIIEGLWLTVGVIGNASPIARHQKELAFDAGFQLEAFGGSIGDQPFQEIAWRLCNRLAIHPSIGG